MKTVINLPSYAQDYLKPCRYKLLGGSRDAAKTSSVASLIVLSTLQKKHRVLCCREIQNKMSESTYESLRAAALRNGVSHLFKFLRDRIICLQTNSEFFFYGLLKNPDSILSLEGMTICWIDQAEAIGKESWDILMPTIRSEGSEIFITWNPRHPTDRVEKLKEMYKEESIYKHVTYKDNPFHTKVMEIERKLCQKHMPEDYEHIWLGHFRTSGADNILISYRDIKECVGAAEKLNYTPNGWHYLGLDVADGGKDVPAYCLRHSSSIIKVKELSAKNTYDTITAIWPLTTDYNIARCHYDASGVGAGIKAEFIRCAKAGLSKGAASMSPDPFLFGGKVKGADRIFAHGLKNSDFFSRANSQGFWNLKLRVRNTIRALKGDPVNLDRCLFLPKDIPEKALQELSQIEYDRDGSDKIKIIKSPNGTESPNMADAIMMAFARDLIYGLVAI